MSKEIQKTKYRTIPEPDFWVGDIVVIDEGCQAVIVAASFVNREDYCTRTIKNGWSYLAKMDEAGNVIELSKQDILYKKQL